MLRKNNLIVVSRNSNALIALKKCRVGAALRADHQWLYDYPQMRMFVTRKKVTSMIE